MREQRRGERVEVGVGQAAGAAQLMRTPTSGPPRAAASALSHTIARAASFSLAATASSRSSITAVAPSPSALSILRRSLPGTKRTVRSGGWCWSSPARIRQTFVLVRTSVVPGARTTGGAWSVALCSLAMAAGSYATLGFAPLAPLIREDFSLTRWQVGAITAIVFGGAAISSVPSGRLTDRFGAPPMLAAAVAAVACGCAARRDRARARLFFLLGVGAVGLAYGLITPPTNVIVRGAPTTRHRSLLMSIKQVGVTIGGFIAGVTMPTIAHHVGWRLALLAPAAACCAVALSALLSRRTLARNAGDARRATAIGPQHGDLPRPLRARRGRLRVRHGRPADRLRDLSQPVPQGGARLPAGGGGHLAGGHDGGRHGRPAALGASSRIASSPRGAPSGLRLNALLSMAGMTGLALLPSGAADLAVRRARGLREHRLERRLHDARGRVGARAGASGASPGGRCGSCSPAPWSCRRSSAWWPTGPAGGRPGWAPAPSRRWPRSR